MARWMCESRRAHPVVGQIRRAYHVWTNASLQMTEHWLDLWRQSGLPLERARVAATTSSMAIVGLVEEETIFQEMARPGDTALSRLPNARLMFDAPHDRDAEFELVVRSLIEGLHARLARG
jgi:hypothetical protein